MKEPIGEGVNIIAEMINDIRIGSSNQQPLKVQPEPVPGFCVYKFFN